MTNRVQSMLTVALTFTVIALVADRLIESAQAQDCPSSREAQRQADRVIERVLYCVNGSGISMNGENGTLYTFCDK